MSPRVTVVVPGLAGPAARGTASAGEAAAALLAGLELPGFTALMGHARLERAACTGETLAEIGTALLGVVTGAAAQFPAAALARAGGRGGGDPAPGIWMRADPVHLRADMGKLVVFPADVLSLTLDQSARVREWLVAHPLYDGPDLELVDATCWVCALPQATGMTSVSPQAAYGSSADDVVARGGDAPRWHARMNEVQMLLHECPVNAERERDGLAPVNSLWYWGEGELPPAPVSGGGFDRVHADDAVIAGAARVAGIDAQPAGVSGDAWCRRLAPGRHLLAIGALELPARAHDVDAWRRALAELDAAWLAPLAAALDAGRLPAVDLCVAGGVARARRATLWQRLRGAADAGESLRRLRDVVLA